jgi:hypothetical protein
MASKQAITRVQAIAIVFVVVVAAITGIWYHTQTVSEPNPAPFSMDVISRPFTPMKGEGEIPMAIPEQRVVFLVIVKETGEGSGYGDFVDISGTASGAVIVVNNPKIKPGEVCEVIIVPDQTGVNKILTISINGNRKGFMQTETIDIEIVDLRDDYSELAQEMRDKFIPWLTTNHPELGISGETEWIGTIVNPRILVVMHYMFLSQKWEMYVTWHVMIPPYDWTKIYLRPRFKETQSTLAFEISSVEGEEEPHSIELPDWV